MKQLVLTLITITFIAITASAQSKDEQAIIKIHKDLEQAYVNRQIAPFEAAFSDDYIFSGTDGKAMTRAEMLSDMRKEEAKPTFKTISDTTDALKVKLVGDIAYVTGNWTSVSQSVDVPPTEPHADKGRFTSIYEKRDGKWMLVAEHYSEQQHDRKLMEAGVLKASKAYTDAMLARDKVAYERLLHADYTFTNEEGKVISRADDIAHVGSGETTLSIVEVTEQKVRILGNTSALETGVYYAKGTSKGKPFEEKGRFSTVWLWRNGRWLAASDHVSLIK